MDKSDKYGLNYLQEIEKNILKECLKIFQKYKLRYYALGGTLLGAVRHKGFIPWDDDIDIGMPRDDYEQFMNVYSKELPSHLELQFYQTHVSYHNYVPKVVDKRVKVIDHSAQIPQHQYAWIDIFPLDGTPNNKILRKIHSFHLLFRRMMVNYSLFSTSVNLKTAKRPWHERVMIKLGQLLPFEKILNSKKELGKLDKALKKYTYTQSDYIANFMGAYKLRELFPKKYYLEQSKYSFEDIEIIGPKNYDVILTQLYGKYLELPDETCRNHHHTEIIDSGKENSNA